MRMKTEQTRQRIVDAAYACFWRSGFTRTSIDSMGATGRRNRGRGGNPSRNFGR